ncbi:MAG TPA: hypothetical protein PKA90_05370 [Ignavibacteria bacterium]|nr:hypothetical protein [Ignavibacteria bacterium]HMR39841.1 hypothetical protein [Ignavibacteria bacterium]
MNIFNKSDLRKYFIRDDVLKTIVSIVTGVFIIYFNAFGGLLLVEMLYESSFGNFESNILRFLITIPLGMAAGYVLLKLIIKITFRIFNSDGMEEYSLIRFILLLSIIVYIIILALYFILYLINIPF